MQPAGDLDGDGALDLLVLPDNAASDAPVGFVFTAVVSGSTADAGIRLLAGFRISARPMLGGFDSDGDGLDELLVGDPYDAGAVYLLEAPLSGDVDLTTAPFQLTGDAEEVPGVAVCAPTDFDGDGTADLAIGADA